ncbi:hypothetical protein [Sinorhizobium sp. RAC02]|uniref:hypothetical protein n=1 Tax=Sinorhizobium sp. RAC02 TaxID=1842534 RepID=UPI00083D4DDB|nr:hypothetical protein [Sinorhizobium sp. RAC02]
MQERKDDIVTEARAVRPAPRSGMLLLLAAGISFTTGAGTGLWHSIMYDEHHPDPTLAVPFNLILGILVSFGTFMVLPGILFAARWLFWPSARTPWFQAQTALFVVTAGVFLAIFFGWFRHLGREKTFGIRSAQK